MEIKFRGKQVDSGEWYHGYYVKAPRWGDGHYIIMDYHGPSTIAYEVDGDTVGMYTGLKDKNGVEIFKGDVVSIKYCITRNPHWNQPVEEKVTRVEYDSQTLSYGLFETMQECKGGYGKIISIEIIGNIHDNPELLEAAE